MKKNSVFVSLGNDNNADNKIVLDGKELDLNKVTYFALECRGINRHWVIGNKGPINLESNQSIVSKLKKLLGWK